MKPRKKIRSITFTEEKIMQVANEDDTIDIFVGHKVDKITIKRRFIFNPKTLDDYRGNIEYLLHHGILKENEK